MSIDKDRQLLIHYLASMHIIFRKQSATHQAVILDLLTFDMLDKAFIHNLGTTSSLSKVDSTLELC